MAGDRHKPFQRLTLDAHVRALVFPLLAASNLGNVEPRKVTQQEAAARLSRYLTENADTKGVYMKINYVNADYVHALVDLPTNLSIEELIQLLKGSSSHWVNANNILARKFAWGRGYGAFSVSESNVAQVAAYTAGQEEHHRVRTFADELQEFIERHGLRWQDEKSR